MVGGHEMKVAIARYVRNPDSYFFDLFDAAAAGVLQQAGHQVTVVERMPAPGFAEEELIQGLTDYLTGFGPELVFLSYLPSASFATRVREATGAVVATFGSRLLLEVPEVDYVISEPDPLACLELAEVVAGERNPSRVASLSWRDGDEVRCSGVPLHNMFEIFTAAPLAYDLFVRLGPGVPVESRKHIAGDWGCVYRRSPLPAAEWSKGIPTHVFGGGCTFCSRPGSAPLDWDLKEHVLGKQLDQVLAAFPDLSKLIVIDEQALSYADRLARLLHPRPLDGVSVLLSGRLDHLVRHREKLEEALDILHRKCSVSLYQFGLENLSDSTLVRFNKGLKYDDIRNSLKIMDELSATHANLEVERSFGFILFDPWTTVDELRENVERSREIGLDRYRGRAAMTSVRLLPEMPMYWQARAEGLVDDHLQASDFGYSVNSGWRFKDKEVARIHRELTTHGGSEDSWSLLERILSA